MSAQLSQRAAQLRLKNHHQRDREEDGKAANDPTDHHQVQKLRNERERKKNNRQTGEHFRAARATEIKVTVVDHHAQQDDLESAAPFIEPKLGDLMDHRRAARSASVARRALAFGATSCTRRICAPRSRKSDVIATVALDRSSWASQIFARKDLRETPTTSGRSSTRRRGRLASNSRLCPTVLPNPMPGSNAMHMGSTPDRTASSYRCRKKSATSATTSL